MEAKEGPETTVKLITGHKRASLTYGRMCVDPSTQGEYTNKALQSKSTSKINGCRSYLQPLRPILSSKYNVHRHRLRHLLVGAAASSGDTKPQRAFQRLPCVRAGASVFVQPLEALRSLPTDRTAMSRATRPCVHSVQRPSRGGGVAGRWACAAGRAATDRRFDWPRAKRSGCTVLGRSVSWKVGIHANAHSSPVPVVLLVSDSNCRMRLFANYYDVEAHERIE